jgi:hypothetical protein
LIGKSKVIYRLGLGSKLKRYEDRKVVQETMTSFLITGI